MSGVRNDLRSVAEKRTHYLGVAGTDTFLSGWGRARGGSSVMVWAYDPEETDGDVILMHVRARSDMRSIHAVDLRKYRPGGGCVHLQIEPVGEGHPYFVAVKKGGVR